MSDPDWRGRDESLDDFTARWTAYLATNPSPQTLYDRAIEERIAALESAAPAVKPVVDREVAGLDQCAHDLNKAIRHLLAGLLAHLHSLLEPEDVCAGSHAREVVEVDDGLVEVGAEAIAHASDATGRLTARAASETLTEDRTRRSGVAS